MLTNNETWTFEDDGTYSVVLGADQASESKRRLTNERERTNVDVIAKASDPKGGLPFAEGAPAAAVATSKKNRTKRSLSLAWSVLYPPFLNLIKTLPLMNSPLPILVIWILYMVFVLKVGPSLMKTRSAYNMGKIMTLYNAFQVAISAYFVYKGLPMVWRVGLSPKCLHDKEFAIDYFTNFHIYYMIKITELLDTVFFVLRRKFSQVTFLHLYHHSYMLLSTWFVLRFDPTLAVLFAGLVNSFVHLVMYTYYGLSAYPTLAKYLWWKKYITTLQLVQFVLITMQLVHQYHFSECPPSIFTAYNGVLHCLLFLGLFSHFYINAYLKPSDVQKTTSKKIS